MRVFFGLGLVAAGIGGLLFTADPAALKVQGPDSAGNPVPFVQVPAGASGTFQVFQTASQTGAATPVGGTLTGAIGKTTYITGFAATASGSTAALDVYVTVTGTISGTLNYTFTFPTGATAVATPLIVNFNPPIPASATNTAITVTLPSGGTGNTNAAVSVYGFQQ